MTQLNKNRVVEVVIDDTLWRGLRISGRVEKKLGSAPNTASLRVYNLPKEAGLRYAARGADLRVEIRAGYGKAVPLFIGQPEEGGFVFYRQGGDLIADIRLADGIAALQNTRVRVEEASGAKNFLDLVKGAVGGVAGLFSSVEDAEDVLNKPATGGGFSFVGSPLDFLDEVAASTESAVYYAGDRLRFVGRGETIGAGPLFSEESGSLYSAQPRKEGVQVTGPLYPALEPGGGFRVEGEFIVGSFRAEAVTHTFDTGYSSEFSTTALGKVLQRRSP